MYPGVAATVSSKNKHDDGATTPKVPSIIKRIKQRDDRKEKKMTGFEVKKVVKKAKRSD